MLLSSGAKLGGTYLGTWAFEIWKLFDLFLMAHDVEMSQEITPSRREADSDSIKYDKIYFAPCADQIWYMGYKEREMGVDIKFTNLNKQ